MAHWNGDHSGSTIVPTGASSDPASWVHATFTYDADGGFGEGTGLGQIYYNGVPDAWILDRQDPTSKTPPSQATANNFLLLGARNGGEKGFDGQIDDVAFWDHVVSAADIMAVGTGASLPTAIADPAQLFYDFNEGSGGSATSVATGSGLWDVPANHNFVLPFPPGPAETAQELAPGK